MIMQGVLKEQGFLLLLAKFGTLHPAPMEGTYFLARSIEIEEELWGETLLDNPVEKT